MINNNIHNLNFFTDMAQKKYLDLAGLQSLVDKLMAREFKGMGLSHVDFTAEQNTRLNALHEKLSAFDPSSVATDTNLAALQDKVNGLAAIINSEETPDGNKIIDKLNEVFAFLADVSSDDKLKALLDGKADKATTLAGYGITDAKIANGVITLGTQSITPLTEHQSLAAYAKTADVNTGLAAKADKTATETALAGKVDDADLVAITSAEIDTMLA